jgi:integrase
VQNGLQLAVMANALGTNPVHDVGSIKSKRQPKGAPALTADELRELLAKLRESETCHRRDLVDPISVLIATRDPDNFAGQWRAARNELGVPDVSTHSFRKTVATLIDDAGLSARIGADHLGHARVSMTQDRYMSRGRQHTQVADLLDDAVSNPGSQ